MSGVFSIFVKNKSMTRIFRFGEFNKIESAVFRLKNTERTDEEVCYTGTLTINGEKILGQIFCDSSGDLECFQFFQKDGSDICEKYGYDVMESVIKQKLKRFNK